MNITGGKISKQGLAKQFVADSLTYETQNKSNNKQELDWVTNVVGGSAAKQSVADSLTYETQSDGKSQSQSQSQSESHCVVATL